MELRMTKVVVTTGAIRCSKLLSNRNHQQTNTRLFMGPLPFLSPSQQSTEGRHYQIARTFSSQAHMGSFNLVFDDWRLVVTQREGCQVSHQLSDASTRYRFTGCSSVTLTTRVTADTISVHLNGHFPGGPRLAGTRMFPFWILLELRLMEVMVTTGTISRAKLQSNHHHQQTNIQLFYRPDALPVAQPTVSKCWREITGCCYYYIF